MAYSFTPEEQRFVLAEMIKSSAIGIENLVGFVRSNGIVPNWEEMQLPHGRNMRQCMQVAEHFSIPSSPLLNSRPAISRNGHASQHIAEHPSQFAAIMGPVSHHSGHPSAAQSHVTILPRPTSSIYGNGRIPLEQAPKPPTKRRGRPPNKTRLDLHANLPPLAPWPPQPAPGPNAPRAILPRTFDSQVSASPSAYAAPAPAPASSSRVKKKRRLTAPAASASAAATAHVAASVPTSPNGSVRPASNNPKRDMPSNSDSST